MTLDVKRWPPANFVQLGAALVEALGVRIVLVGGPGDEAIVAQVAAGLDGATDAVAFVGELSFGQIAALAADARGYIGNDTGLTHLAGAAGARTVMILGPSDPARYAPFVADALTLWKPGRVGAGGVSGGVSADWTWARDGIGAEDVIPQVIDYLTGQR
jgi:ADP-heptose:LPS heptosyltransferase